MGFKSIDSYKPTKLETQTVFFFLENKKNKKKKKTKTTNNNQESVNFPTNSKKRKRSPLLTELGGSLVIRRVGSNGRTRLQDRVDKIHSFFSSFDKPFQNTQESYKWVILDG
jgi:hypothetical protein